MYEREMSVAQVVGCLNQLTALSVWLRPGRLAFYFGQMRHALMGAAQAAEEQIEGLRQTYVQKDANGGYLMAQTANGGQEFAFASSYHRTTFLAEHRAVLEARVKVVLPVTLTDGMIDALDEAMMPDRADVQRPPVDFAALLPLTDTNTEGAAPDAKPQTRRRKGIT